MPTYVTPSLGAQVILKNPTDRIADLIRTYAKAPKSISNTLNKLTISLQDTLSQYSDAGDRDVVIGPITTELTEALQRCFPNADYVNVTVTTSLSSAVVGAYDVTIKPIVVINSISYSVNETTPVKDGIIVLSNDSVS